MKIRILLIASCVLSAVAARAADFLLKPAEVPALIEALGSLDGYEKAYDQGPGNSARIIREPYKFTRETRAKLGADRAALLAAWKLFQEQVGAERLKISGDAERIDATDAAQMKLWLAASARLEALPLPIDLSPITADELTINENPIPISALSILNRLRPSIK
jgi:hypothetical protein